MDFSKRAKYSKVPTDASQDDAETASPAPKRKWTHKLPGVLLLLEHIALVLLGLFVLSHRFDNGKCDRPQSPHSKLLASELPFAEDAVEYEDIIFDPSGFWDDGSQKTPWEGPVNEANEAEWARILSVGMLSISTEELASTGLKSNPVLDQPGQYIVTVEMFHQIHCLHYLKQLLYGVAPKELSPAGDKAHLDHCVDYLRQVIMCHGDLTPITLGWNEAVDWYWPNFRIKHTCRNFDRIFEFAEKYNTSGATIE